MTVWSTAALALTKGAGKSQQGQCPRAANLTVPGGRDAR